MNKLKIFNEFGIIPTTNYTAAGLDFYIPDLFGKENDESIWNALAKSYKVDLDVLYDLGDILRTTVMAVSDLPGEFIIDNTLNIVHLYCSLDTLNYEIKGKCVKYDEAYRQIFVNMFVDNYLIIPKDVNGKFGISARLNNSVFFNSGIRVALNCNTAGVFMNKSGKGNCGWDIRSCVVDEDYTGLVHLSLSYTKSNTEGSQLYIGDKITQMLILPIVQIGEVTCLTKENYDEIMKDSCRGDKGFGSSDEKH